MAAQPSATAPLLDSTQLFAQHLPETLQEGDFFRDRIGRIFALLSQKCDAEIATPRLHDDDFAGNWWRARQVIMTGRHVIKTGGLESGCAS
jgi:hypothetical protein